MHVLGNFRYQRKSDDLECWNHRRFIHAYGRHVIIHKYKTSNNRDTSLRFTEDNTLETDDGYIAQVYPPDASLRLVPKRSATPNCCQQFEVLEDKYLCSRCSHLHHGVRYLGAPNRSGNVCLYTSKTAWTTWSLDDQVLHYTGSTFDPSEVQLVVARYLESYEWLRPYEDIAIVYDKCGRVHDTPNDPMRVVPLPNVGREGHTYLFHLARCPIYAKRTIFTQADPFCHNPTMLFGIDNYEKHDEVQAMGLRYLGDHPPTVVVAKHCVHTDYGMDYMRVVANGNLRSQWFDDSGMNSLPRLMLTNYRRDDFTPLSATEAFLRRSQFPLAISPIDEVEFTFCGLFSITDRVAKQFTTDTYLRMMQELTRGHLHGGPNGYVLEKLWLYLFERQDRLLANRTPT